jgi:hypothetical protein
MFVAHIVFLSFFQGKPRQGQAAPSGQGKAASLRRGPKKMPAFDAETSECLFFVQKFPDIETACDLQIRP